MSVGIELWIEREKFVVLIKSWRLMWGQNWAIKRDIVPSRSSPRPIVPQKRKDRPCYEIDPRNKLQTWGTQLLGLRSELVRRHNLWSTKYIEQHESCRFHGSLATKGVYFDLPLAIIFNMYYMEDRPGGWFVYEIRTVQKAKAEHECQELRFPAIHGYCKGYNDRRE
jgi:hypothetical protein